MTVCGVICEYNPFHLGHGKQLRLIREQFGEDTVVVALMSGSFVQRGEPAIFDKLTRAKAAVLSGANLVLELPVTCCLRSAEGFASGGVELLTRLGCVDKLAFGCECGDLEAVLAAARAMDGAEFESRLREKMATGCSYAAARQRALQSLGADAAVLEKPNDILAVEYCRALLRLQSRMQPLAIRRAGDYHAAHAEQENPSATSVRALLTNGGDWRAFVPREAADVYEAAAIHTLQAGARAVFARLRGMTQAEWESCAHGSEGLWSKARTAAEGCRDLETLLAAVKSKRYPRTRLQRLVMCAYLGISQQMLQQTPEYVRVLAFDDAGRAALRQMKKTAQIALVNAGERLSGTAYYDLERRAAGLYDLFCAADAADAVRREEEYRIFQKKT